MLTQLTTIKSRLALVVTDYDDILTAAIRAVSGRFDKETNRTLARPRRSPHTLPKNRLSACMERWTRNNPPEDVPLINFEPAAVILWGDVRGDRADGVRCFEALVWPLEPVAFCWNCQHPQA